MIPCGSIGETVFNPIVPVLVGKYDKEHARAIKDLTAKGKTILFINENPDYSPNPGVGSLSPTSVGGKAIQTIVDPQRYEAQGLIEVEGPTLLFAPNEYGAFPDIGDTAVWRGLKHRVQAIELLAPDAVTIIAFILLELQDSGVQDVLPTVFGSEHERVLKDLEKAGRPAIFTETARVYTPETGLSSISQITVSGHAIRTRGNKRQYEKLGLVERDTVSLLFAPTTFGEVPSTGMKVDWGNFDYIVRWVARIAPDGGAIISRVVISK